MPKIHPIEVGCIVDEAEDWNMYGKHIQGIAQAGNFTVISSSDDSRALVFARGDGNRKKVVFDRSLPNGFEHAGGIGVLKVCERGWRIVVPVWSRTCKESGAIVHYFFSCTSGIQDLKCTRITKLNSARPYAVGIARNGDRVVMAVVVDNKGKKILFLTCNDRNGECKYEKLGSVWNAEDLSECDKNEWCPDSNWGGYPNSISLINHGCKIYFVGMHNGCAGIGKDWVDIYDVNLDENASNERLRKKQHFHAICNAPSFRWGGSARIHNGMVEILAVGRDAQNNERVRYNKFRLGVDNNAQLEPLNSYGIVTEKVDVLTG